jgi:hypothetical protein
VKVARIESFHCFCSIQSAVTRHRAEWFDPRRDIWKEHFRWRGALLLYWFSLNWRKSVGAVDTLFIGRLRFKKAWGML